MDKHSSQVLQDQSQMGLELDQSSSLQTLESERTLKFFRILQPFSYEIITIQLILYLIMVRLLKKTPGPYPHIPIQLVWDKNRKSIIFRSITNDLNIGCKNSFEIHDMEITFENLTEKMKITFKHILDGSPHTQVEPKGLG